MGSTMTPFPALHTTANSAADEHVAEARSLVENAESWLAELDEILGEAKAS